MAHASRLLSVFVFFSFVCIFFPIFAMSFHEELSASPFLHIGSDLACELVKCLKGKCVNSSSFPFYECECDAGWKSPFKASWMPCILPNCSIDLTCANTSMEAPFSPSIPSYRSGFDVCSLHVCGNGKCVSKNTSATEDAVDYECVCDSGFINFGNSVNGFCVPKCSIGADCTNVNLTFGKSGGSPSPPPIVTSPVQSSYSGASQGTSPSPLPGTQSHSTSSGILVSFH
ncbi:hypothetical protein KP509_38G041800 [Ceratopteris richardii]|uniref:EGF-like domain-containing protein n=1 Tax=Ceratopteris richardii TaxID=49495 RepID=A0A8T2Q4D1_CERRI|nr:hypothetical protein KP509_38G041800 [Ceratopteris richardii]